MRIFKKYIHVITKSLQIAKFPTIDVTSHLFSLLKTLSEYTRSSSSTGEALSSLQAFCTNEVLDLTERTETTDTEELRAVVLVLDSL